MAPSQDQIDHFWARVDRSGGEEACWPWLGACAPYGHLGWSWPDGHRTERAHRIAFMLSNGHLPRGKSRDALVIRHRCDNPPCCNPAHLLLGTHVDNWMDCVSRGRSTPPPTYHQEGHPRAKLTVAAVRWARGQHKAGVSCAELARRLGVGWTTMGHALAGRTWIDA